MGEGSPEDEDVPPRVLAAERRREFRQMIEDSSLGCPNDTPGCWETLDEHDYVESDTLNKYGHPVHAICRYCDCGHR